MYDRVLGRTAVREEGAVANPGATRDEKVRSLPSESGPASTVVRCHNIVSVCTGSVLTPSGIGVQGVSNM